MTIGGGTGGSGIKHLSDPHNPRDGSGWVIKAEKQVVSGGDSGLISDTNIPKHEVPKNGDDQYDAADDLMGRIILKVGGEGLDHEWYVKTGFLSTSTEYGGRTSEDISDGPVDPGPGYIKEEKQIDIGGDDIGIIPVLWKGGEGGYISEGDLPLDPTSWIVDHTNSFSGDWGT
jgi:hypothetical protein